MESAHMVDDHPQDQQVEDVCPLVNLPTEIITAIAENLDSHSIFKLINATDFSKDCLLYVLYPFMTRAITREGDDPPLTWAATHGYTDLVGWYLHGDPTAMDQFNAQGYNAIHCAARAGQNEVIAHLLMRGANIEALSQHGQTALHLATKTNHEDTIDYLLQHNANTTAIDVCGYTAIVYAVLSEHIPSIKVFIDQGVDINASAVPVFYRTPLHYAACNGRLKSFAELLAYGGNPNVVDSVSGNSAAHLAISYHRHYPRLLSDFETFPPQLKIDAGRGPLEVIIPMLTLVKLYGGSITVPDNVGQTALHLAISWRINYVSKFLIAYREGLDIKARLGFTPLHVAAVRHDLNTFKLLMEAGADCTIQRNDGLTALMMLTDAERTLIHEAAARDPPQARLPPVTVASAFTFGIIAIMIALILISDTDY